MAGGRYIKQADFLPSSKYLNAINDATVGGALTNAPSGIGTQGAATQPGDRILLDTAGALALSYTTTGTLYGGIYQYVQFKSGSTASNAVGQLVFWSDPTTYLVTPDAAAGNLGLVAGVTLNSVTKGNYGWIQIAGLATVKCAASVADTTAGDLGIVTQTPANTVDGVADATGTLTYKLIKSIVGTFYDAPANGALKRLMLRTIPQGI